MKKKKTVNVKEIYNVETKFTNTGFILEFWNDSYKIRLHFELWWVKYIALELWKVITKRRKDLTDLENDMKGD